MATSVLVGALFVGDSMRGSLRSIAIERLGAIDHVVVGSRLFSEDLDARYVSASNGSCRAAATALLFQASVVNPATDASVRVNVIGCDSRFWRLFPPLPGRTEPADRAEKVVINRALADDLDLKTGDRLVLKLEKPSPVPKEALLGDRTAERSLLSMPLDLSEVIESRGVGRFSLETSQKIPRNIFVPLRSLQNALDVGRQVNALLVSDDQDAAGGNDRLARVLQLADFGINIRKEPAFRYLSIETPRQILEDTAVRTALAAADHLNLRAYPMLAYLANSIERNGRSVPYSIVLAAEGVAKRLPLASGSGDLPNGHMLVNRWTADQLQAAVGDEIRLQFFLPTQDGTLQTGSAAFRLSGIVEMEGMALDRGFVPPFKGITDATTFANWDSPFPVDLKKIRKVDEDYWKQFRTAPKCFVSYGDGVRLWTSRFGKATAVRIELPDEVEIDLAAANVAEALRNRLRPVDFGISLQPVRQMAIQSSIGSTDFGQLFVAFSFFTILAAGMLIGLLFRLNVERRASEIGLLLAVGFEPAKVRNLLLWEGLTIALAGGAIGILGATVYARLMIDWLTSRWKAAIGIPFIDFHGTAASVVLGVVASTIIALVAIWWAAGGVGGASIPRLLRGSFSVATGVRRKRGPIANLLAAAFAAAGFGAAIAGGAGLSPAACFFSSGILILIAGILACIAMIGSQRHGWLAGRGWRAVGKLAVRNAGRYPTRTSLTIGMVSCASFLLLSLGAMSRSADPEAASKDSGNGGFWVLAETAISVVGDLNTAQGKFDAGISEEGARSLESWRVFAFRSRPGDDASCLNVYQPGSPTLLAASDAFIQRGGFRFSQTMPRLSASESNPWELLYHRFDDGAIPVIGDANSLQWILKKSVGSDLEILGDDGTPVKLRIVGALSGSLFQGQLIAAETQFAQRFPDRGGSRMFLFEPVAPPTATPMHLDEEQRSRQAGLMSLLRRELSGYGVSTETPMARIAAFAMVEKTYLGAFQTLGGFGLVLGTFGLGAVIARNILERRGELGLMLAVGFGTVLTGWLLLAEALYLTLTGVVVGAVSAILAVAPVVWKTGFIGWKEMTWLALSVLLASIVSGIIALALGFRGSIVHMLRQAD